MAQRLNDVLDERFDRLSSAAPKTAAAKIQAMNADLRDRLRRLGVQKGTAHLKPRPPSAARIAALNGDIEPVIEHVPHAAGQVPLVATLEPERTPFGDAFARREVFAADHVHGNRALAASLAHAPEFVAQFAPRRVRSFDLRNTLFLDTETTGLAGGAGTLAFMVGLGYFDDAGRFTIEQYFLKDPGREAAMLAAIDKRVAARDGLVTFNGKSFDIPLLETRYTLSRIAPSFEEKDHLDLLMPARRVWKASIGSCRLSALEAHLLGVERSQQDIAGFLIPQLYREYLNAGLSAQNTLNDEMSRVMYHNLHDILSMVTLISRLCDVLAHPRDARERLQAGVYYEGAGVPEQAERIYAQSLGSEVQHNARNRLARLLKTQKRHGEATAHWQALADADSLDALIELAKHYEWRERDLPQALANALRARAICNDATTVAELDQRIARLQRKSQHAA
jgi:uncharacterized protein